jgi:hypothetical protein
LEKSSRLRIARFSLGMVTPEPRRCGVCPDFQWPRRTGARVSVTPAK